MNIVAGGGIKYAMGFHINWKKVSNSKVSWKRKGV